MRAVAWASVAALALVVAYLALGGASYAPAKVADPCVHARLARAAGVRGGRRADRLSALDGAACKLGVSREEIVLALREPRLARSASPASTASRTASSRTSSAPASLRAVDDAEEADAIGGTVAGLLRGIAAPRPVDELLDLLEQLPGL